jgi:hypothetical protein
LGLRSLHRSGPVGPTAGLSSPVWPDRRSCCGARTRHGLRDNRTAVGAVAVRDWRKQRPGRGPNAHTEHDHASGVLPRRYRGCDRGQPHHRSSSGLANSRLAVSRCTAIAILAKTAVFLSIASLVNRGRPPVDKLDMAPTSSYRGGHVGAPTALYMSHSPSWGCASSAPGCGGPRF